MKRLVVLGIVAVTLTFTSGCGNSPDSLAKQMISQVNDLASAIEKKESPEKIKSSAEKVQATKEKMDALKLSDEEKKKLEEKYKKEMGDAISRLFAAILANPEGARAAEAMGGLGNKK